MKNTGKDNKELKSLSSADIYNQTGFLLKRYYNDPPIAVNWDLVKQISNSLDSLYSKSNEDNLYWTDCPLKVYKETLEKRLMYLRKKDQNPDLDLDYLMFQDFMFYDRIPRNKERVLIADNEDLTDFVSYNYFTILNRIDSTSGEFVFSKIRTKFENSRQKKKEYIQKYFRNRGKEIIEKENKYYLKEFSGNQVNTIGDIQPVKWKGNNVELAELIKSLIEAGKLEGLNQNVIFQRFAAFFNFPLKETKGLQNITTRAENGGEVSKFLIYLKDALETYNENREERNLNNSQRK